MGGLRLLLIALVVCLWTACSGERAAALDAAAATAAAEGLRGGSELVLLSLLNGDVEAVDARSGRLLWRLEGATPAVAARSERGWPQLIPALDGSLYRVVDDDRRTTQQAQRHHHQRVVERVDPARGPIFSTDASRAGVLLSRVETTAIVLDAATGKVLRELDWHGAERSISPSSFDENATTLTQADGAASVVVLSKTEVGVRVLDVATGADVVSASLTHVTPSLVTDSACMLPAEFGGADKAQKTDAGRADKGSAGLELLGKVSWDRRELTMKNAASGEVVWTYALRSALLDAHGINSVGVTLVDAQSELAGAQSAQLGLELASDSDFSVEPAEEIIVQKAEGCYYVDHQLSATAATAAAAAAAIATADSESGRIADDKDMLLGVHQVSDGLNARTTRARGDGGGSSLTPHATVRPLSYPPPSYPHGLELFSQRLPQNEWRRAGRFASRREAPATVVELGGAALLGAALVLAPVALIYGWRSYKRKLARRDAKLLRGTGANEQPSISATFAPKSNGLRAELSAVASEIGFVTQRSSARNSELNRFEQPHIASSTLKKRSADETEMACGGSASLDSTDHVEANESGAVVRALNEIAATAWDAESVSNAGSSAVVGRIEHSTRVLGYGGHGTVVFEGWLLPERRPIAVKRLLRQFFGAARKEIAVLIELEHASQHIVRYFAMEEDAQFIYLALELCDETLAECVAAGVPPAMCKEPPPDVDVSSDVPSATQNALREVMLGLSELHSHGIVHRDIKPHNVLVQRRRRRYRGRSESSSGNGVHDSRSSNVDAAEYHVKLADVGLAARLDEDRSSYTGGESNAAGTVGWRAPEVLQKGRLTKAVDIFSAGCLVYYVLTRGAHPFGEALYERESCVMSGKHDLRALRALNLPEAEDLVRAMIARKADVRPTAEAALHHPFFWSDATRLAFLCDVSDRVLAEYGWRLMPWQVNRAIAQNGEYDRWPSKLDMLLLIHLGRGYELTLLDLLRVVRNKRSHFLEFPLEVQELVGPLPTDKTQRDHNYLRYFTRRFPNLIMDVYRLVRLHPKLFCFDDHFERYGFERVEVPQPKSGLSRAELGTIKVDVQSLFPSSAEPSAATKAVNAAIDERRRYDVAALEAVRASTVVRARTQQLLDLVISCGNGQPKISVASESPSSAIPEHSDPRMVQLQHTAREIARAALSPHAPASRWMQMFFTSPGE